MPTNLNEISRYAEAWYDHGAKPACQLSKSIRRYLVKKYPKDYLYHSDFQGLVSQKTYLHLKGIVDGATSATSTSSATPEASFDHAAEAAFLDHAAEAPSLDYAAEAASLDHAAQVASLDHAAEVASQPTTSASEQTYECCICLSDVYTVEKPNAGLTCSHLTHKGCLLLWWFGKDPTSENVRECTICPFCRRTTPDDHPLRTENGLPTPRNDPDIDLNGPGDETQDRPAEEVPIWVVENVSVCVYPRPGVWEDPDRRARFLAQEYLRYVRMRYRVMYGNYWSIVREDIDYFTSRGLQVPPVSQRGRFTAIQ